MVLIATGQYQHMKANEYTPLQLVKRINKPGTPEKINLGIIVSSRPIKREPGQYYGLIRYPWSNQALEYNLRVLAVA